jgi:hypothetical protein
MPAIATTIADVNVRSHSFEFIFPTMTDNYNIPNPCDQPMYRFNVGIRADCTRS